MSKFYAGGIPEDGKVLFPGSDSEGQDLVNPNAGPSEVGFKSVGLGSIDSSGDTGKDVNPPAEGEVSIVSRKVVSNQP